MSDEIIEELWRVKDSIAREHGYDLERLVAALESRKYRHGGRTVDLRALRQATKQGSSSKARSLPDESVTDPAS
ncbi:MAG: hypothetical protein J4F30_10865 [Acidobacteria bacterium]|nr:hypothetical protein [Acidobacteriota bacterium]